MPEEICTVGLCHRQIACMSACSWARSSVRCLPCVYGCSLGHQDFAGLTSHLKSETLRIDVSGDWQERASLENRPDAHATITISTGMQ